MIEGLVVAEVAFEVGLLDLDLLVIDQDRCLESPVDHQKEHHKETKDDATMRLQRAPVVLKEDLDLLREHIKLIQVAAPSTLQMVIIHRCRCCSYQVCIKI